MKDWLKNPWVIGGGLVLIGLLVWISIVGTHKIGNWFARREVAANNAEMDAQQKTLNELRAENVRLQRDLKNAIDDANAAKVDRDQYKAALEQSGKATREAAAAIAEAQKNYDAEKQSINAPATTHARCTAVCTERAGLGYPCRPSVERFCARYGGQ